MTILYLILAIFKDFDCYLSTFNKINIK